MLQKTFVNKFFLTASEVNSQREMPLSRIVTMLIDTATAHANIIGIGFDRMIRDGISWVLSRLTVDMLAPISVNRSYSLETWVESTSRLFSERDFEMVDDETGQVVVRAHSTWMAVNMSTRRPSDLTAVFENLDVVSERKFEGDKGGRFSPVANPERELTYRFAVSDIDVNRHVTTRRYIDLITDLWSLDHYDLMRPSRFEVAFKREVHCGDLACVVAAPCATEPDTNDVEISVDSVSCCFAKITFQPRQIDK